jgi:hypothetical protein
MRIGKDLGSDIDVLISEDEYAQRRFFRDTYARALRDHGRTYQRTRRDDCWFDLVAITGVIRQVHFAGLSIGPNKDGVYEFDVSKEDWQQAAHHARRLVLEEHMHLYTQGVIRKNWFTGMAEVTRLSRKSLIAQNFEYLRGE